MSLVVSRALFEKWFASPLFAATRATDTARARGCIARAYVPLLALPATCAGGDSAPVTCVIQVFPMHLTLHQGRYRDRFVRRSILGLGYRAKVIPQVPTDSPRSEGYLFARKTEIRRHDAIDARFRDLAIKRDEYNGARSLSVPPGTRV